MSASTISVVPPAYNAGANLAHALRSGACSRPPPPAETEAFELEIIVVNDGSTDDTANILRAAQGDDDRIKVITNERNEGIVASLNKGIHQAAGAKSSAPVPGRCARFFSTPSAMAGGGMPGGLCGSWRFRGGRRRWRDASGRHSVK